MRRNSQLFLIFTLAGLSAFGPFVTDMYLPTLPRMPEIFSCSVFWAQMGLSASMFGLAAGQLVIGPLSDRCGRRVPLLVSLVVFAAASVGCLLAPDVYFFTGMRLLQGLGGAGGIVLSRSISSDLHTGRDLVKFLSIIAAVHGVAPVAAPVAGGLFLTFTNWRGIFAALLGVGVALLAASAFLEEPLPKERRFVGSFWAPFALFKRVLSDKICALYILQQACVSGVLFGYIASSAFIFQTHFGLSPLGFSLCFGINAVGLGCGSYAARRFERPPQAIVWGSVGALGAACLLAPLLYAGAPVWAFEGALLAMLACCGITFPSAATLILDIQRKNAGTASALLGAFPFIVGGVAAPLVGWGNVPFTAAAAIGAFALGAAALAVFAARRVGAAYLAMGAASAHD